jgi:ribosome-associated protein
MDHEASGSERAVAVREEPIELSRLLKLAGATESGGEAKQIITDGLVRVNGEVELRKGRKLRAGDRVTFGAETFVVEVG